MESNAIQELRHLVERLPECAAKASLRGLVIAVEITPTDTEREGQLDPSSRDLL
jgi:hypothetical protein